MPYTYRRRYYVPEENINDREYYKELPDKLKKLTQFVNQRAAKLKSYVDSKSRINVPDIQESSEDLETFISDFQQFRKNFMPPVIDDSNDFEFRDNESNDEIVDENLPYDSEDEEVEIERDDDDEIGRYRNKLDNILRSNEDDGKLAIEASGKQPPNDDKIEETVDFAYPPGDPRFYKTTTIRTGKTFFLSLYFNFAQKTN